MDRTKIIMILFALYTGLLYGQNLQIEWNQCFGGSDSDYAYDIIEIDEGYFIIGYTVSDDGDISFNHGSSDGWIVKTDYDGNMIWEKTFGGSQGDNFYRILSIDNDDCYLLGVSNSSDGDISNDPYPGTWDFWIVKIDIDGNILWDKIVGGNGDEVLITGTTTDDGGVVAIGWTSSGDGDVTEHFGTYDMWMIKLNSEGIVTWDFSIGTSYFDNGHVIIQTSDGGFLVGGGTTILGEKGNLICEPFNYGYQEAVLVKLDSNRNIEWQQCYGGSGHEAVNYILELSDGYVFVGNAGSNDGDLTDSGYHGEGDIWLVKTDFSGNILWQKCLGGSRHEGAMNLLKTSDDGFIVAGMTKSNDGDVTGNHSINEYEYDIWVVGLNGSGVILWQQCFGGVWNEALYSGIVQKSDNNFVIAGQTDYGPSFDVACTPYGGLYDEDFWIFEVKDTITNVDVNEIGNPIVKVYPNPAKDYVVFELNEKPTNSIIQIVNVFGKQVETLSIKTEKTVWDTREVKNGIYFYKIEIDSKVLSGKIVIQ